MHSQKVKIHNQLQMKSLCNLVIASRKLLSLRSFSSIASTAQVEIERKFVVTNNVIDYCKSHSTSVKKIQLIDTYYDNKKYDLTTKDMWLRERNGSWELKAAVSTSTTSSSTDKVQGIDHYNEITDNEEIITYLQTHTNGIPSNLPISEVQRKSLSNDFLSSVGITPFARLVSHRTRYFLSIPLSLSLHTLPTKSQNAYVDIDNVVYDASYIPTTAAAATTGEQHRYTIGEIELIPPLPQDMHYEEVMKGIMLELKIDFAPVRGKLLEYLSRYHPLHYEALAQSGQLQGKGIVK